MFLQGVYISKESKQGTFTFLLITFLIFNQFSIWLKFWNARTYGFSTIPSNPVYVETCWRYQRGRKKFKIATRITLQPLRCKQTERQASSIRLYLLGLLYWWRSPWHLENRGGGRFLSSKWSGKCIPMILCRCRLTLDAWRSVCLYPYSVFWASFNPCDMFRPKTIIGLKFQTKNILLTENHQWCNNEHDNM